jgi:hypothetical protein
MWILTSKNQTNLVVNCDLEDSGEILHPVNSGSSGAASSYYNSRWYNIKLRCLKYCPWESKFLLRYMNATIAIKIVVPWKLSYVSFPLGAYNIITRALNNRWITQTPQYASQEDHMLMLKTEGVESRKKEWVFSPRESFRSQRNVTTRSYCQFRIPPPLVTIRAKFFTKVSS